MKSSSVLLKFLKGRAIWMVGCRLSLIEAISETEVPGRGGGAGNLNS